MSDVRTRGRAVLEDALAYPGLPEHKSAAILLRIWQYPAFESEVSWLVLRQKKQLFVRRLSFDQRQSSLEPVTYGAEAPIPRAVVESMISELERITLAPFIQRGSIGIDGCVFGVEFGDYMANSRFEWWGDAPSGWEALGAWFENAVGSFDRLLPAYSASAYR